MVYRCVSRTMTATVVLRASLRVVLAEWHPATQAKPLRRTHRALLPPPQKERAHELTTKELALSLDMQPFVFQTCLTFAMGGKVRVSRVDRRDLLEKSGAEESDEKGVETQEHL